MFAVLRTMLAVFGTVLCVPSGRGACLMGSGFVSGNHCRAFVLGRGQFLDWRDGG